MNRTYEEWLKYYKNATKEQVIEDMILDIKEIQRLNNRIDKAIEYIEIGLANEEEAEELLKILKGENND